MSTDIFILNDAQREAINEAREQIRNGQFLISEEADKEIDEWLERSDSDPLIEWKPLKNSGKGVKDSAQHHDKYLYGKK